METVQYGLYQLSKATSTVISIARGENAETYQATYRVSLNTFNANAKLLINNLTDKYLRWQMADNLKPIRNEIYFIAGVINQQNHTPKKKSLRVTYLDTLIRIFETSNKSLDADTIEKIQQAVTKIT